MKTDKVGLTRLISALGKPAEQSQRRSTASPQQAQRAYQQSSDAVKIADGFGRGTRPTDEADSVKRQEKVEQLKSLVKQGGFKPSSENVAVAIVKELGI